MVFHLETKDTGKTPFRFQKLAKEYHCDAMLLSFSDCTILWDTDFACTAPFVIKALRETLHGRPLDYIFLTHSHYDHAAGTPYIKAAFPEAAVVASVHADEVFRKASAREKMLALDDALAVRSGFKIADREPFASLHADITVKENDLLMAGSHPVRILDMPGHTRDSICFLFERENILLGTETLGVYRNGVFGVAMLVGYAPTIASLERTLSLPIDAFMPPHGAGVLFGKENIHAYLRDVIRAAEATKNSILSVLEAGNWEEKAMDEAVRMLAGSGYFYDNTMEKARILNSGLMVRQLYREFCPS